MNILNFKTMQTTKTVNTIKLLALLFISSLAFTGCSDDDDHDHDDDDHDHEEEVITTLNYILTSEDGDTITFTFKDIDGDGGEDGEYSFSGDLTLTSNSSYTGAIELLNETEDPAEDITAEILEEAEEHEFFFSSSVDGVTVTKDDEDADGNPIGLKTIVTTGEAGTGTLTVILKHEPTKPNDGSSLDAGGATDIEVTFSIEVEEKESEILDDAVETVKELINII